MYLQDTKIRREKQGILFAFWPFEISAMRYCMAVFVCKSFAVYLHFSALCKREKERQPHLPAGLPVPHN
jgi:hypothetical protein